MQLKLSLDPDEMRRLAEIASRDRRPIPWQAEVLLRRALGLPDRGSADKPALAEAAHE